jgi:hypothetical protein
MKPKNNQIELFQWNPKNSKDTPGNRTERLEIVRSIGKSSVSSEEGCNEAATIYMLYTTCDTCSPQRVV